MNRRSYLAVVGTGVVGGCLGNGGEDEPESEPEVGARADHDLPPVEEEPDPQPTDDETDHDESDESDDNARETSDDIELERAIGRAEDEYRRAMAAFATDVDRDEPAFIDVLPSNAVDFNNAQEHLDAARDILWYEARDFAHTDAQKARVREYRTYNEPIRTLYRVQQSIHRSYTALDYPENGSYGSPPSSLASGRDRHDELGREMAEKEIYMSELQRKYDQQAWQLSLLKRTFSGLTTVGSRRWLSRRSTEELRAARDDFEFVIDELDDLTAAPPTDRTDTAFLELVEAWHALVDEELPD